MRRALAPTRIAELQLERGPAYTNDIDGHHEPTHYQPAGIRLDNDGCKTYWLMPATVYTVEHDGVGWRVEPVGGWSNGHVYRLADAAGPKGSFVSYLPLAGDGRLDLLPGTLYQLELASNPEMTRSGLYLSTLD